jgi:TRAP-type C4-dicarboxylate transport system substrate-binding protein
MFKKIWFWILVLLLATGLPAQYGRAASKVYNWNYNTFYDRTYYVGGSHIQQWADAVWEETHHQLKINIFYTGSLGYKGTEIMSSLRDGLLPASEFSASMYGAEAGQKWWSFNDFLAHYSNWEQVKAVDKVAFPMMWQDIEDFKGVKPLALFPCCPKDAFQGIWMNKKIENWQDFRGKKLRLFYALARKYVLNPVGFESLFLPGPETYQGLKTGLIDGIIQTPEAGLSSHYDEIAKYFYACLPITVSWWGIICSQKAFDDLPKDVQEGLVRASKAHEKFLVDKVWLNQCAYSPGPGGSPYCVKDAVEALKKKGNIIVKVPLLTKKFQEQSLVGLKQWIETEGGPKAQKLYDVLLEAKKKYPHLDSPVFTSLDEWTVKE